MIGTEMTARCACGVTFAYVRRGKRPRSRCDACLRATKERITRASYDRLRPAPVIGVEMTASCGCGRDFVYLRRTACPRRVCDECRSARRKAAAQRRNSTPIAQARHYARKKVRRAKVLHNVDPVELYKIDGGVCGICGRSVDPQDFQVDHIRPLARGGEHSYWNCQIAHPICNQRKGARWVA